MNNPAATLTPASQQALAEAALVLQLAQGFVYLPLLVQSERAGALAMEQLRPALRAEPFRVPWPLPQPHTDDPALAEQRVQDELQALLSALDGASHRLPAGAVLLLDGSSSVRHAVARRLPVFLNQRREDWRRRGQGLLLLWPQAERDALMQGAPDLWSVRAAAPWLDEQDAATPWLPSPEPLTADAPPAATPLSPAQQRQLRALQTVERWADADVSATDVLALVAALRQHHQHGAGLALAERALNAPEFGQQAPEWRARFFNELAILRSQMGDHSGALAPAQEAVAIYRRLAQANPAAYEPALAVCLNHLATHMSGTGDRVGALAPAQAALEIRRRLAKADPAAHEPGLASSLNNLANRLSETGDRGAALAAAQEAVEIRRRLAQGNQAAYEPALAGSLSNLASHLSQAGDRAGALASVNDALGIYRRLAKAAPAIYEPAVAMCLNNLAISLSETGDRAAALAPAVEAVEIRRSLAQANPAAHEPDLASSLNNLANRLTETGNYTDALAPAQEALDIRRRLARANPAAYEPGLAMSLRTVMRCHAATGHHELALAHGRESQKLYAQLAEREPARFEAHQQSVEAELKQLGAEGNGALAPRDAPSGPP